ALGRYQLDNNGLPMRDKPLLTYLIVNVCLDLGKSAVMNRQSVLRPNAMIILALHWPCEGSGCVNNGIGLKIGKFSIEYRVIEVDYINNNLRSRIARRPSDRIAALFLHFICAFMA